MACTMLGGLRFMGRKRIVVLGASSGGCTAALALKDRVGARHDVTVIARTEQFVFVPSLALLALGERTEAQTAFSVRQTFAGRGIAFRAEPALRLDLLRRRVITPSTEERYDFLVIATGARPNYSAVPGLGPRGYTHAITSLAQAQLARSAFAAFFAAPGPVVIGDVQGAFDRAQGRALVAAVARILKAQGRGDVVPTHLTAGPADPGEGFTSVGEASVSEVTPGQIRLLDGRRLPFTLSVLLPPFLGVDLVRACDRIADPAGFVRVNAFQHTEAFPEVFGAGAAVAGDPFHHSPLDFERRAQRAADNIAACLEGRPMAPHDARLTTAAERAAWEAAAFAQWFGA